MTRASILPLILLAGCGGAPPTARVESAAPKPPDETRRFPLADQAGMRLIDNKLLGKNFLPGGNLAEYKHGKKAWRQFLARASSTQSAGLLLFDFKNTLRDPKYLAHMGGYFGYDGTQPVYVFQKGPYLAGIIGLPEKDADPLARQFAARLN